MLRQQSTESDWDKSCRVQNLNREKVGIVLAGYSTLGCSVKDYLSRFK
jgi:hypothetical protein